VGTGREVLPHAVPKQTLCDVTCDRLIITALSSSTGTKGGIRPGCYNKTLLLISICMGDSVSRLWVLAVRWKNRFNTVVVIRAMVVLTSLLCPSRRVRGSELQR
jgi:hypothetical protein